MHINVSLRNSIAPKVISACLVMLMLFAFAPAAKAMDSTAYQMMKVTAERLNVRSGPGTNWNVIAVFTKGTVVELVGESGKWSKICWYDATQFRTGYVFSSYLKRTQNTLYFATEPVNVRSKPNTSGKILGVLEGGEAVVYLKKSGSWVMVQYGGATAYVHGKYLSKNRKDCFYAEPVAKIIGKRSIKSVGYSYLPGADARFGTGVVPVLEIVYTVRMQRAENEMEIYVYRFDSEYDAKRARNSISQMTLVPDGTNTYYQNGDTVIVYKLFIGLKSTAAERELYNKVRDGIRTQYGEHIKLKGE